MSKRKRILLTNDDGYFSDGINVLYRELKKTAEVCIVAPDREQSASSHSLTLDRPLRVHKLDTHRYSIDGTPTDCVMLAVQLLFKRKRPDMIISGVNHGANMGEDVTYSGTVAAAIEGSILRIPSLAVSMANWEPGTPMTRAARFVVKLISHYERLKLDPATFLNINVPADNGRPYRKFEFTKLGVRLYKDYVTHKTDPRGRAYYWIGGRATWKNMKESDFEAVQRGVVSITPLKLNFTDSISFERLSKLPLNL
jgi:5'-nucleotidase